MIEKQRSFLVRIAGRVQGVNFRVWTRTEAMRLGLRGWVRNEPDASVTALVSGDASKVETMIELLRRGPDAARVTKVTVEPAERPASGSFSILR